MKITFHCPNCSVALRVDESYAGRKLPCPKCKQELEIPSFQDNKQARGREHAKTRALSSDLLHDGTDATNAPIPQDTTFVGAPDPTETVGFELASAVVDELERFEPPAPAPDDPMLKNFPDFVPNPFACSYPLDQIVAEEEEEDATPTNSKMPSVDELIN